MKANIPPFTVGQKVVCIQSFSGHTDSIKEGVLYTISEAKYSEEWGHIVYLYGQKCPWSEPTKWFVPAQEQTAPLLTFEKIKETEKQKEMLEKQILMNS